ncbi:MFS transporter [Halovivax limisalsi]|uniref:MFS transporter n=1 Tax=Halovivax limisalsi TaxID=1453760 RepID=UPI001FFD6CD6|nr:MFS transporter [Halovivax limisalsi]
MPTIQRVVWHYYAYRVTTSIGLYLPVGVVFLTEVRNFGLDAVGTIMAAYLVAMLLAELPTGYLGDRVGRRASLAVGSAVTATAMAAWPLLETPLQYLCINVFWATGTTFRSGTASALLYEILDETGSADQFARISGRAATLRLLASAIGALAAGLLVTVDWSAPFLANAALAALGIPLLVTLPRVDGETRHSGGQPSFRVRDALRTIRLQTSRPDIRWFVAYTALFYGVYQLGMAFEQPAMRAAGVPVAGLGAVYAGFKFVSAGAASTAGWLQDRLGARGVYLGIAPVVGIAFASAAVWPVLVVPALFVSRGASAVSRPIRNQYLNDRLDDVGRATVLSGASMVLSVCAAILDVVGGVIATGTGPVKLLAGAGIAAAGAGGLLWLLVDPVRTGETHLTGGESPAVAPE